jgi:tetratricopeptide (TPR) repeat protein/serine/threonine protein kinase
LLFTISLTQSAADFVVESRGRAMSADDEYEIFESLGTNDYLSVLRGWNRSLRRYVAIMQLHPRFRASPQLFENVWSEILASASIEHYGLVRIYDVDKERGWIITELMKGRLADRIANAPLTSDEARSVLSTALESLEYIHARSKLHGDVRPANFLIDDEGHVRLSHPVGLAVGGQIPRRTVNQKYLAPELVSADNEEPGPTTDLYCLGFSVYEMLVGSEFDDRIIHFASASGSTAALNWLRWHSSLDSQLPPIAELVPHVAGDVAAAVDQLVAKRVADRPQSARAALDLLDQAAGAEQVCFPVTTPENAEAAPPPSPDPTVVVPIRQGEPMASPSIRPGSSPGSKSRPPAGGKSSDKKVGLSFDNPFVKGATWVVVLAVAGIVGLMLQPKDEQEGNKSGNGEEPAQPDVVVTSPKDDPPNDWEAPVEELRKSIALLKADVASLRSEAKTVKRDAADQASALEIRLAQLEARTQSPAPNVGPDLSAEQLAERARVKLQESDYEGAVEDINDAIRLDDSQSDKWSVIAYRAYLGHGRQLLEAKRFDEAISQFTSAFDVAKAARDQATALVARGKARVAANNLDAAIADYTHAIELEPQLAEAFIMRGDAHQLARQPKDAVSDYTEALRIEPRTPVLVARARSRMALGELSEAARDVEDAVANGIAVQQETMTQFVEALLKRSQELLNAKKYDLAIGDLEAARRLDPDGAETWGKMWGDAHYKRGTALAGQDRHESALADFDKVLSLAQGRFRLEQAVHYGALTNRGWCYIKLHDYPKAVADLTSAIELDSRHTVAYRNRHVAYKMMGDPQRASADLASARQLDPNFVP